MVLTFALKGRNRFRLLILGVIYASVSFAQDPEFSQFYANPIYTNPAFAGSSNVGRGVLNYRSQWPGISGTFKTFSASYDEHFDAVNGGMGVIVTNDVAGVGVLNTTTVNAIYSYQVIVNKNLTFRAGIQAGFVQKAIDFSKLTFSDQIIKNYGFVKATGEVPIANNVTYPNFSAGIVGYSSRFYAGFAVHNMTEPKQAFLGGTAPPNADVVPRRYTAHAGLVIPLIATRDEKKSSNLWPNILYMQQGQFTQLNLGMYYNRRSLVLGSYYRINSVNGDAAIFLIGFRLPKTRFGFSYDATTSEAKYGATQSFEVSIAVELRKRVPRKSVKTIRCPEF